MPFRSIALILTLLLAALPTEPVHAQTGKASAKKSATVTLPIAPDRPDRWRQAVRHDSDALKYRCLRGPASTPLCAIANRMTCELHWSEVKEKDGMQFCRNAYIHLPPQVDELYVRESRLELQYRIEAVGVVTAKDIEAAKRTEDWKVLSPETEPRKGDLLVTILRRTCSQRPPCVHPDDYNYSLVTAKDAPWDTHSTFCLRKEGSRWRLVWWPNEPPYPGDYRLVPDKLRRTAP